MLSYAEAKVFPLSRVQKVVGSGGGGRKRDLTLPLRQNCLGSGELLRKQMCVEK